MQRQVDTFVRYYNEVRPHRGINRRTPIEVFEARTKARPRLQGVDVEGYRVRRDIVDNFGSVTIRYLSRLHRHRGRSALQRSACHPARCRPRHPCPGPPRPAHPQADLGPKPRLPTPGLTWRVYDVSRTMSPMSRDITFVEVLGRYSNLSDQGKRLHDLVDMAISDSPTPIQRTRRQSQHRLSLGEARQLAAAYQGGTTINELADRYKIHRTTVMSILHRDAINTRYRLLSDRQLSQAIELYAQGLSLLNVSRQLGVNHGTVRRALLKAGVAIRPRHGWQY